MEEEKKRNAACAVHVTKFASQDWFLLDPHEISKTYSDLKIALEGQAQE